MIRLRDRSTCPPNGFVFEEQDGWESRKEDPESRWDFKRLCKSVLNHRLQNPDLGLSVIPKEIAEEVDQQQAQRVANIPGGSDFVVHDFSTMVSGNGVGTPASKNSWRIYSPLKSDKTAHGLTVVLPICERDTKPMLKNLQWMKHLGGCGGFNAVVFQDESMRAASAEGVISAAREVFTDVGVVRYDRPPVIRWPRAANWVFQCAAWFALEELKCPFFWMEADCVPVKRGWLDAWNDEYSKCGQPMMGAIVGTMGHCNGTAIYPADFAELSVAAMGALDIAWDWAMRPETIHLTHNSKLMCHVWGIEGGKAMPFAGAAATFRSKQDVERWVCPESVLFHRSKDGTLIDQLMKI